MAAAGAMGGGRRPLDPPLWNKIAEITQRFCLCPPRFWTMNGLLNAINSTMGARRNFSRGWQNHRHFKKLTRFWRAVQKIDHFSARRRRKQNFLHFFAGPRLKYRVSIPSVEGASKNFRVFCTTAAYEVIFSNSRGEQGPPLRAPMNSTRLLVA